VTIVGNGGVFNSQGRDSDLYAAIDQSVEKMERQIRERREKVRQKRSNPSSLKTSPQGVGETSGEKEEKGSPSLVRRRRLLAKPMSPEEAVSQLVFSKKDFLIFINSDSGQMNVVTRSKGGGYEWVEPHPK
jgi:putative sigma-54 modulation protein